ncbi:hypothetical protein Tco_0452287 [Tanacetum coccineum]
MLVRGRGFRFLHLANDECVPDGRLACVGRWCVPFKLLDSQDVIVESLQNGDGYLNPIRRVKKKDVSDECNFDGKPEAQEENNIFEESEEEKVQETEFGVPSGEKVNKSEDPFGIYSLLQKNKTNMENKVNEEDHSLSHPPGFTKVDQFEG